jgi:tRNA uridine 5-carboxymethylaminomethyl modification enzyme
MFTSRAEHRLHLRNDNADERLAELGRSIGLVDDSRWKAFIARRERIATAEQLLATQKLDCQPAIDWLRRQDHDWLVLAEKLPALSAISPAVGELVATRVKYAGYIARQDKAIERFAKMETKLIPSDFDYARVTGLRNEAKQKLSKFTPRSLGQALRISGITPADVTVLAIAIDRRN